MAKHYFEGVGVWGNSTLAGELERHQRTARADSTGRHVPAHDKRREAIQHIKTALDAVARDLAYSDYIDLVNQCGKAWVDFCQKTYGGQYKMSWKTRLSLLRK